MTLWDVLAIIGALTVTGLVLMGGWILVVEARRRRGGGR